MKKTNALFVSLLGLVLAGSPANLPGQTNTAPSNDPGAVSAGTGSISGILAVPANTGLTPVITVTIIPTGETATTDTTGSYTLANLKPGRYSLLVDSPGYARLKIENVLVQPGQVTTVVPRTLSSLATSNRVAGTAEQEITALPEFVVNEQKAQAFVDHNADLARTVDDIQPYYIFDAQTINDSGAVDTEDFLRQNLSMDTNAKPASYAAPNGVSGGGGSIINLRGVGSNQTLILIDGRRTPNGNQTGTSYQPDLNGIPLSMIDRIEVLPSSSSAIYGGGSVGGVIDLILKKNFTGGNLTTTYSNTMDADTPTRRINGAYGFTLEGGKTQVTISGSRSESVPIYLEDRRFVLDYLQEFITNRPGLLYNSSVPYAGATPNIALYTGAYTGLSNTGYVYGPAFTNPNNTSLVLKNGTSLNSLFTYVPAGTAPGSAGLAAGLLADAGQYNLNPSPGTTTDGLHSQFGLTQSYKAIVASVQRQMTKDITFYVDFTTNSSGGTYTYTQWSGNNLVIPGNAPGNPFNDNVKIYMPVTEVFPTYVDLVNQSVASGAVIKLPFDWTAMLDYTWSQVEKSYSGVTGGLDGPTLGGYTNTVEADSDSGALSPFFDTVAYPIANLSKYNLAGQVTQPSTLNDISLRASGPLPVFQKFLGGTTLTFGLEHRKEGEKNGSSEPINAAEQASPENRVNTLFFGQDESTNSVYAELDSVIIEPKREIPLINSLSIQTAFRTEQYTVTTGTASYTSVVFPQDQIAADGGPESASALGFSPATSNGVAVTAPIRNPANYTSTNPVYGLKYDIIPALAFRASYSEAFLPPTFAQLLVGTYQTSALTTITDPVNGQTYGVNTFGGGNPNTKPQTSKDWDYGFVYEPRGGWLKGLRASLGYYRISESNVITTYPNVQYIVSNIPSRLTRSPTTGLITLVDDTNTNLLGLKTSGFDGQINYIMDTPIGTVSIGALGSIIEHLKKQVTFGQPYLEYDGYVASGGAAKSDGTAHLNWSRGHFRAGWTTHFVDSYDEYEAPSDPSYGPVANPSGTVAYTVALGSNRVASQVYHNAFVAYTFGQPKPNHDKHGILDYVDSGTTLTVNVNDVFNTVPPYDPFYGPYYFSPFGSILLRTYQITLSIPF